MTRNHGYSRWVSSLLPLALICLSIVGCSKETKLFKQVQAAQSGLDFVNELEESDSLSILDYLYFYNGGGLAVGDVNNDGLLDVFLSSNQHANQLYLNKGGLQFENISEVAGIRGQSSWNTGAVMADVNGDGWLDIYVLAVVGINGFTGHNELYINNQDGSFTERSADYNLDIEAYGTTASFFDYDLDGDLDVYILNHAVHTQESFGRAQLRKKKDPRTGDRLFRNDGDTFTDVTDQAGIYSGANGYGLGVSVADFNNDGYPDIYVGNDFHEDDYFYLNRGDGTFNERLRDFFGHTTRFSMGNDAADINGDGLVDLISMDMLPYEERVVKSSEGDDTHQTLKMRTEQYGYHYQYSRNMLYLNREHGAFEERALLSGVAATDWSWSALFEDLDQDGQLDLFVSNGIPKRPNDLDYIRYVSSQEIQKSLETGRLMDQEALDRMPTGLVPNQVFKGDGQGGFEKYTHQWLDEQPSVSGATAVADLDNDGDLDIVTNNIGQAAGLYENQTNTNAHYLKLRFELPGRNGFGIGTKAIVHAGGKSQSRELFPNRGWQSSGPPLVHFGLGNNAGIDSVRIIWPNRQSELFTGIPADQTVVLRPDQPQPYFAKTRTATLFEEVPDKLGLDFIHREDNQTDFDYQKLAPYDTSTRGPALAVGDLDMDGLQDVFLGGARLQPSEIYLQRSEGFVKTPYPAFRADSLAENISAVIVDLDKDGKNDLALANGGNLVAPSIRVNTDRLHLSSQAYLGQDLTETIQNSSVIKASDYDRDGDTDLFVAGHTRIHQIGELPQSHLLENSPDGFKPRQQELFSELGMLTDALWDDFNGDGEVDLIVVGEWEPVRFFAADNGQFEEVFPLKERITGLWQAIHPFDIDGDGDTDYLLGNWGLNSKFAATQEMPMLMYYADFDGNGTGETVVSTAQEGVYYPLLNLDLLASQMPELRKKFPDFASFAGQPIDQVIDAAKLKTARRFEVNNLASGFLRNTNGTFNFVPFPSLMQIAPIRAFATFDFDGDGFLETVAGGNYFGLIPFHGRLDSFAGAMIDDDGTVISGDKLGLDLSLRAVNQMKLLHYKEQPYLLISTNDDAIQLYKINN